MSLTLLYHLHTVTKFAQEKVAPLVKEMDEKEELDQSVIKGLFEQGVSAPVINPYCMHLAFCGFSVNVIAACTL